jgi:hypothetical protein
VSVYIPAELRRRIRAHFRDHCAYCRTPEALTVVTFEFEHIVPSSLGGETVFQNLCLSCPTCNRYKSDRTVGSSDPATVEFPLFHPHLNDWNEHFEWSSDATVIIGLTQIAQVTIATLRMNRPQIVRVRRLWAAMNEHPPMF